MALTHGQCCQIGTTTVQDKVRGGFTGGPRGPGTVGVERAEARTVRHAHANRWHRGHRRMVVVVVIVV